MNKRLILILIITNCISVKSQFKGGIGDGFAGIPTYSQPFTSVFSGGQNDGFAIASYSQVGAPLPINLINFTGKKVGNTNQLNWQTSQEINASHFEIERSQGNNIFLKIGEVASLGKSILEKINYQFIDFQPIIDINYYRLKMVDLNGKYEYSKIIGLNFENNNPTVGEFYPNPTTENYSNIDIQAVQPSEWQITKMDISGKVLKTEKRILKKGQNTITVFGFEKGLNIIQFENEKNRIIRKLIH